MNYLRPVSNSTTPIALSDSQKNALTTAMRDAGKDNRQIEISQITIARRLEERQPDTTEELLFIF